jgi:dipeptidyl aminopeptidase/acylaminoacyl peptidase
LAFLSDEGSAGQSQLYVSASAGGGRPRKLTSLKGYLSSPQWSPDGRTIALLMIGSSTRVAGPTEATAAVTGDVDAAVDDQRLVLIDAESGRVHEVTPAGTYVYEFDWSPRGDRIVYTSAPAPGDDNWYNAQLYWVDVALGAIQHLYKPAMQIANPRWSPDGRTIAFISGLMSDEGVTGGDIFTMPANGGTPTDVTPGRKSSPSWFQWLPSSERILFTENIEGQTAIGSLDLQTGQTEQIWRGSETLQFSATADGVSSAVIRSSWSMPPEVWAGSPGTWKQLTTANAKVHPMWGAAESFEWSSDGQRAQGWLLKPAQYDPQKRYPMVVSIHGGPAAQKSSTWPTPFYDLSVLASKGYFVFFPNPRGSFGLGEGFTKGNVKDFGYGDLRDVLTGVDAILQRYPIDEKRLGIGGWSYGGYMTMWTVTQTNRFHAAVAGAGIANWQSYYGENSIDQWLIPYFGASVYDDPQVYAKSSPMTFIKQVKTPTLVVVGERDGECPQPQSYEFWHALKTLGVKTQLIVYPGEGHGFRDPEHIRDVLKRTMQWFDENLK